MSSYPLAFMREVQPVLPREVERLPRGEGLPDLERSSGPLRGHRRCAAVGLTRGDCQQPHVADSIYCYYHDKLHRGMTEPTGKLYPAWPLPNFVHRLGGVVKNRRAVAA